MRKLSVLAALMFLVLGAVSPSCRVQKVPGRPATINVSPAARPGNAFTLDLYAKLRTQPGNLVLSGFNISTALTMAYGGARGQTATEMAKVLHLPADQKELHEKTGALLRELAGRKKVRLDLANALWGQKGYRFVKEYLDGLSANYGAPFNKVDFKRAPASARRAINKWVADNTNNRIKEAVPPGTFDELTRFVITSAIYFKGTWVTRFKKGWTKNAPFHVTKEKTITVPTMRCKEGTFGYMATNQFEALELPYAGHDLAMVILLPREVDGLDELEKSLTAQSMSRRSLLLIPLKQWG